MISEKRYDKGELGKEYKHKYDSKGNEISRKMYYKCKLSSEYKYDKQEEELIYIEYENDKITRKKVMSTSD